MSPESYEYEPKEKIDYCLNCKLPEYMCRGQGECSQVIKRTKTRKQGQLQYEVLMLVKAGKNKHAIARELGISVNTARNTIKRLKDKGVLK